VGPAPSHSPAALFIKTLREAERRVSPSYIAHKADKQLYPLKGAMLGEQRKAQKGRKSKAFCTQAQSGQQCFRENITRDLTGRCFPLQIVSFHLPRPQGSLRCRNKELLGFKADIRCFPQERACSLQVDGTERAASEPRRALCSPDRVLEL